MSVPKLIINFATWGNRFLQNAVNLAFKKKINEIINVFHDYTMSTGPGDIGSTTNQIPNIFATNYNSVTSPASNIYSNNFYLEGVLASDLLRGYYSASYGYIFDADATLNEKINFAFSGSLKFTWSSSDFSPYTTGGADLGSASYKWNYTYTNYLYLYTQARIGSQYTTAAQSDLLRIFGPTLGDTATDESLISSKNFNPTTNQPHINDYGYRHTAGSNWTGTSYKMCFLVDTTKFGCLTFQKNTIGAGSFSHKLNESYDFDIEDNLLVGSVTDITGTTTATNFEKIGTWGGVSWYVSDGTDPHSNLTGTANDFCIDSVNLHIFQCITGTNWATITGSRMSAPAGNKTLGTADHKRVFLADSTGGNRTYTLPDPTAVPHGWECTLKHTTGGNTVKFARYASENIEGAAADYTITAGTQATIKTDNTDWWIIGT